MAPSPRKGLSCSTVAFGLLVVTAVVAGVAVWGYYRFLHYERVAARHLPPDTVAAARVDVEEGVLYEPIRQHVLPVLLESIRAERDDAFAKRFEAATGLERQDLREIVVARGATWDAWLVIVSGLFPREGVLPRLEAFLRAEGDAGWTLQGAPPVLELTGTALALTQASDGTLVAATSKARVLSAAGTYDTASRIRLAVDTPAAFTLSGEPLREIAMHPAALLAPGLSQLGTVERVRGTVGLGEDFRVRVALDAMPGTSPQTLEAGVQRILSALRLIARLTPAADVAGERSVLERAVVEPVTDGSVLISATWRREEADRGARALGEAMRTWMGLPPSAPR